MIKNIMPYLLGGFLLVGSFHSCAQQRIIHPIWAPKAWELRPDDMTTIMGCRAELKGELTHADHPGAQAIKDVFIYGFTSEEDVMTWTVVAPYDAEYNLALLYSGAKTILSGCELEVKSGNSIITENVNQPEWKGKPFIQRHFLQHSLPLKKGINKISLRLSKLSNSQIEAARRAIDRTKKPTLRDHVEKDGFCFWSIELFRPEAYAAIEGVPMI